MSRFPVLIVSIAFLLAAPLAAAERLAGIVTNLTTGKPQAGVELVLQTLQGGMREAARTKSDAKGEFSFEVESSQPYLVRANYQDVNYFRQAPPGTQSVEVMVYDSTAKPEGVRMVADLQRVEAEQGRLHVIQVYVLQNASDPPRSWMADRTLQIYLPQGAQITSSSAAGPGGMPVQSAPVPDDKEKGRYGFVFPLRPGETRFQVNYDLPYSGEATLHPRVLYPTEHVVVMLPTTMEFTPLGSADVYQAMDEGQTKVRVASRLQPGQDVSYRIAGLGSIPVEGEGATAASGEQPAGPGGGLGRPIDTPNPLSGQMWYILGGLVILLAGGAFLVLKRPAPAAPAGGAEPPPPPAFPAAAATSAPPAGARPRLLDALKDELFQLEMDRHQGRVSQEEYERARAALDVTIQRAAERQKSTVQ